MGTFLGTFSRYFSPGFFLFLKVFFSRYFFPGSFLQVHLPGTRIQKYVTLVSDISIEDLADVTLSIEDTEEDEEDEEDEGVPG